VYIKSLWLAEVFFRADIFYRTAERDAVHYFDFNSQHPPFKYRIQGLDAPLSRLFHWQPFSAFSPSFPTVFRLAVCSAIHSFAVINCMRLFLAKSEWQGTLHCRVFELRSATYRSTT